MSVGKSNLPEASEHILQVLRVSAKTSATSGPNLSVLLVVGSLGKGNISPGAGLLTVH